MIDSIYYLITTNSSSSFQDYGGYEVFWGGSSVKFYKFENDEWLSSEIPNFVCDDNINIRVDNINAIDVMYASTFDIVYTTNTSNIWYLKTTDSTLENNYLVKGQTNISLSCTGQDMSNSIGLTADKLKSGESILGIEGSIIELIGQEKTITPTTQEQIITPDTNYNAITKLTINPVTSSIDSNIVPENIKNGVTILGVTGTYTGE